MPMPVPRMNASTVVTPTRPTVHQTALPITDETDSGYWLSDVPRLPVSSWCR